MDSTTAASTVGVAVATIRSWCHRNVIAAVKVAGRWIVDTASLAYRIIALGKEQRMPDIQPLTRAEYETAVARLHGHPVPDQRCPGEYLAYLRTGQTYTSGDQHETLMVRRGAALEQEGYTPPRRTSGPGYAPVLVGDLFGSNKAAYCGLGPRTRDCC